MSWADHCTHTHTHSIAPPSVAQRETFQLTYLNKSKLKLSSWFMQGTGLFFIPFLLLGQYYCIRLYDTEGYDGPLTSTLTLTFHEETHRRLAANYWRFWASQQKHPTMTRALDLSMLILLSSPLSHLPSSYLYCCRSQSIQWYSLCPIS